MRHIETKKEQGEIVLGLNQEELNTLISSLSLAIEQTHDIALITDWFPLYLYLRALQGQFKTKDGG